MQFSDPADKVLIAHQPELYEFISSEFKVWQKIFNFMFPDDLIFEHDPRLKSNEYIALSRIEELLLNINKHPDDVDKNRNMVVLFYDDYSLPLVSDIELIFPGMRDSLVVSPALILFARTLISDKPVEIESQSLLPYYNLALIFKNNTTRSQSAHLQQRLLKLKQDFLETEKYINESGENLRADISLTEQAILHEKEVFESIKSNLYEKYESDIAALKKAFESEIKLRSAVNYWEAKRIKHARAAKNIIALSTYYGSLAVACVGVLIFLIFTFSNSVEKSLLDKNFKYIISAFLVTLVFWGIRLAVKMWLSNIHLANDAEERVVLVQTYLALQKDNVMPDNDDKKVVINSLFRQAADGVVKDDGMPNPIIELLTKNK